MLVGEVGPYRPAYSATPWAAGRQVWGPPFPEHRQTPAEISLQMADKSTTIPVGICEDVPGVVANVTILTDLVILDIPEDDSMSIILGRPFLNTAGAIIDCNKGNVTFHVNGNEHTVHFPRK